MPWHAGGAVMTPQRVVLGGPRVPAGASNRFLGALSAEDLALLTPHLRIVGLERGATLHESGDQLEYVHFPHSGMVSLVVVMRNGATVETATVGRSGAIGAAAGLGSHCTFGRAVVQLPGVAARMPASQFHAAACESRGIHDLAVRCNDLLITQIQQSVACNALHSLDARLCRWLLQTNDCVDGDMLPLTQEFLGQMLGVRRTTVTIAARLLQDAGLIHYRRGLIRIVQRAKLEELSCECYGVVRRQLDRVFPKPPLDNAAS
jgi:CRP-like cAMP-binding protein